MTAKISPLIFLCLALAVSVSTGDLDLSSSGSHHGGSHQSHEINVHVGEDRGDKGPKRSSCQESCFKFSELKPHFLGERFLQGKCTVRQFSPVWNEICTCFFGLGYQCYNIQEEAATTGWTAGTTNNWETTTAPLAWTTESYSTYDSKPMAQTTPWPWPTTFVAETTPTPSYTTE